MAPLRLVVGVHLRGAVMMRTAFDEARHSGEPQQFWTGIGLGIGMRRGMHECMHLFM